jgi:hypothetical protein
MENTPETQQDALSTFLSESEDSSFHFDAATDADFGPTSADESEGFYIMAGANDDQPAENAGEPAYDFSVKTDDGGEQPLADALGGATYDENGSVEEPAGSGLALSLPDNAVATGEPETGIDANMSAPGGPLGCVSTPEEDAAYAARKAAREQEFYL